MCFLLESILIIGANVKRQKLDIKRGEIFERALDIYLEKRRKTKLEPLNKVMI